MDEWSALNEFWNGFGMKAYDENTVPDDAELPYITYEATVGAFDQPVQLSASLWYRSQSWREISQKSIQIAQSIGGGTGISYDGGRLWITKAIPYAQRMNEPGDEGIRRIVLRVNAEYQTVF